MTTADSASGRVDGAAIAEAEQVMAGAGASGIALAVPEVPLAAREALLDAAGRHGLFRAASFTRAEMAVARERGLIGKVDLLAVNLEEACAAAGVAPRYPRIRGREPRVFGGHARGADAEGLATAAARAISAEYPGLLISITAGASGSWSWSGTGLVHQTGPAR